MDVLPFVSDTDLRLRAMLPEAVQVHEREYGRILDKLGTYTGIPAAAIALDIIRYRERRGSGGPE